MDFGKNERRAMALAPDLAAEINNVSIEYGVSKLGWLHFSRGGIEPTDITLQSIRSMF
jgi:hypothetical protein